MKTITKKYFQDFADSIDFPTLIYIFETGRIIAYNSLTRQMADNQLTTVAKLLPETEINLQDIQAQQGSKIYFNRTYYFKRGIKTDIDVELNAITLDSYHIIVAFFEYSYKQAFVNYMKNWLPRFTWKDTENNFLLMNTSFISDLHRRQGISFPVMTKEIVDKATTEKLQADDKNIITTKEPQYHLLQLFKVEGTEGYFCSINRIPLISSNGTVVGIIGTYSLIFNRNEQKEIYDSILRSNNILSQLINRSDTIIMSWKRDTDYHLEYLSSNISNYGYHTEQFYRKEITFKDIICEEDYNKIIVALDNMQKGKSNYYSMVITCKKANGEPVRLKIHIEYVNTNKLDSYFECLVQRVRTKWANNEKDSSSDSSSYHLALDSWERVNRQEQLIKAIEDKCREFSVSYQPIVKTDTAEIIGIEALLRWKSPNLGDVKPMDFLPMSKYLGLQNQLGEFSLTEAGKMYEQIEKYEAKHLNLHLNISLMQLLQPDFISQLIELADTYSIPRHHMILEIKEGLALEDVDLMKKLLFELKKEGFSLALDNFGAGVIDVHSIMEMPFDYIKLDKKFIESYGTPKFNGALVAAILDVIKSMNAKVIVEGVETLNQYEFLLFHEVYAYQGFYHSKPMEKKKLFTLLKGK